VQIYMCHKNIHNAYIMTHIYNVSSQSGPCCNMAKTSFEPVTFEVVTWSFLMFQKTGFEVTTSKNAKWNLIFKTSLENITWKPQYWNLIYSCCWH